MNAVQSLTPSELSIFLLHVAVVRPVFIWGPPGIGKSSLVARFADELAACGVRRLNVSLEAPSTSASARCLTVSRSLRRFQASSATCCAALM